MGGVSRVRSRGLKVALIAAVLCALLASAPLASGHAYLAESDPANSEQVEGIEEVALSFSGDGVQIAEVSVTGPDGEDVSGEAGIDPENSQRVLTPVDIPDTDAGAGIYTVEWEVLADDGHTTSGTLLFSVGEEPLDREQVIALHDEDEGVAAGEAGANALVLLSLIGLVGVPVTLWIAIYPLSGRFALPLRAAERRARSLLSLFAALLLVGVFGLGLARSASLSALSVGGVVEFLRTSLGAVWVAQLGIAAGVLGTLLVAKRRSVPRRFWLGGATAGGLFVQLSVSATSHSASLVDRLQGTLVDFAHIGGAALWLGGLLVLGLVLPPVLRNARNRSEVAGEAVRRFSIVAFTGVTLAATTGLVLAAWHAPDPESLRTTLYGAALSTKVLLVVVALGLGGLTRFVLLRGLGRGEADTDRVVRAVRIEVGVLVCVILVSGLITATPTAAIADDGPSEVTVESDGIELAVLPAEDGGTSVLVDEHEPLVIDATFAGGESAEVEDPTLLMRNDQFDVTHTVDLEETDEGVYSTVQTLPEVGSWDVRVSGQVGESYESEWFRLYNVPDHPDHDDHDHTGEDDTAFAAWLRLGALGVGLIGTLAVLLEAIRFGRD